MVVVSFMFVYINQSVNGPKFRTCSLMMLYTVLGTSRIRCIDKSLARILYYFVMVITYIWSLFTQLGTLIVCIKALLSHQIFASNGWNEKNLSMARIFFVKDLLFFFI